MYGQRDTCSPEANRVLWALHGPSDEGLLVCLVRLRTDGCELLVAVPGEICYRRVHRSSASAVEQGAFLQEQLHRAGWTI